MSEWQPRKRRSVVFRRTCNSSEAIQLWRVGFDTRDIAYELFVHESVIYNNLPEWRKEIAA